ncbi:winged helix-turn-helix domain-containing protein [Agrobacterium salinitolerans]|uniref:winged helix-turn-helix domain-containing protein n=1 Tax=Agrobacterium salinitolerans TaxID=1183413 RepID=UPI0022B85418|nr:winged helix-turn-helix domain-containing protein [Agrobacterium salinitolerans]
MNIDPMDARFMTIAEIAKELGVSTDELKAALPALTEEGFPPPDPLFANRRYWPKVKVFFDWRYHLADDEMLSVNRSLEVRKGPGGRIW